MQEINRLYEELKNFESISKIYLESKKEANMLANEIDKLKREKNMVDTAELNLKIKTIEDELLVIEREIECSELLKNTCLKIDELENVFKNIDDDEICAAKADKYMKTLLSGYVVSNETAYEIFGIESFYR